MLHTPHRALAAALLLLTLTQVAFPGTPTPARLDDLERHAGQAVVVQGVARQEGNHLLLAWAGHAVEVVPPDGGAPTPTGLVEVEGDLARRGRELVLYADAVRPWR